MQPPQARPIVEELFLSWRYSLSDQDPQTIFSDMKLSCRRRKSSGVSDGLYLGQDHCKACQAKLKGRNGIYSKSGWFSDAMAFSWKVSRGCRYSIIYGGNVNFFVLYMTTSIDRLFIVIVVFTPTSNPPSLAVYPVQENDECNWKLAVRDVDSNFDYTTGHLATLYPSLTS